MTLRLQMEAQVISNNVLGFCANMVVYFCSYAGCACDIVHVEEADFVETFWQLEARTPWTSVCMD